MFSRRFLSLTGVVLILFLVVLAAGVPAAQAQGSSPLAVGTATPTVPPNPNPCASTRLQTVQADSNIFYAPDIRASSPYKLKAGSRFFVCTNNTNPSWTAFILVGNAGGVQKPLWAPNGVFG